MQAVHQYDLWQNTKLVICMVFVVYDYMGLMVYYLAIGYGMVESLLTYWFFLIIFIIEND